MSEVPKKSIEIPDELLEEVITALKEAIRDVMGGGKSPDESLPHRISAVQAVVEEKRLQVGNALGEVLSQYPDRINAHVLAITAVDSLAGVMETSRNVNVNELYAVLPAYFKRNIDRFLALIP